MLSWHDCKKPFPEESAPDLDSWVMKPFPFQERSGRATGFVLEATPYPDVIICVVGLRQTLLKERQEVGLLIMSPTLEPLESLRWLM